MGAKTDEVMDNPNGGQLDEADRDDGATDPEAIRAEIRETRERMGDTIEEIGERLNPNRLKEQVKDNIRDATIGRVKAMTQQAVDRVNVTGRTITNAIRDNPIPAAMVGVGLGWLIWSGRQQGSPRTGARFAGGTAGSRRELSGAYSGGTEFSGTYAESGASELDAAQRGVEVGETVKEAAGELANRAQNVASRVAERTRAGGRRVQQQFEANPLALATATLALGVAAGLTAPPTRREVELVGDARDKLVDRVRNAARDTKDKVQHVAERVVDEAQVAARQEGLTS